MKSKMMLALCGLVVAGHVATAQIEQGTFLLSGSASISNSSSESTYTSGGTSTTIENPKYSSFSLMPWAGYMVTEDFGVGLGIGYSTSKTVTKDLFVTDDQQTSSTTQIIVMPGVRYYYVHSDLVHLYAQLNIPIGFGNNKEVYEDGSTTTETKSDVSTFGVGISPGATISLTDRCGLDFSYGFLGFNSYTEKTDGTDFFGEPFTNEFKSSDFGLSWANTFQFGILFTF